MAVRPDEVTHGPQAFLAALEDFHWLDYARLLQRWCAVLGPAG